jgi:RimJ/RimL family protein N-acetyltransferase
VCADAVGPGFYGLGGQLDFARGAAMSRGGKPVVALPSTADGGRRSRIVPVISCGGGVVTGRGDVHWVVTEYGAVYLHGKTIRERALALASIAHPDFRKELTDHIREKHYARVDKSAFDEVNDPYPESWVRVRDFGGDPLTVRPLRPNDVTRLRDFFYSHSLETIYHRYFTVKRELSHEEARHLCSVDYRQRMAFGVLAPDEEKDGEEKLVAVGRYDLNPRTGFAETAIVVGETWRGRGIGQYLLELLCEYGQEQGLRGIRAEIAAGNQGMVRIHQRLGHEVKWNGVARVYQIRHEFLSAPPPPRGEGSPRSAPREAVT